jgi:hypothetical protein
LKWAGAESVPFILARRSMTENNRAHDGLLWPDRKDLPPKATISLSFVSCRFSRTTLSHFWRRCWKGFE